jgi:hypothetical protein
MLGDFLARFTEGWPIPSNAKIAVMAAFRRLQSLTKNARNSPVWPPE